MAPRSTEQFELIRTTTAEKITAAALELFAENGFKNTSVAAIAKRASVSKGLMYNYFDSKEALLNSIVESFQKMEESFMKGKSLEDFTIKTLLDMYFGMIESKNPNGKMFLSFALDASNLDVVKHYMKTKTKNGLKILESIFLKHGIDNPYEEAVLFISAIEGALVLSITSEEEFPLESLKKTLYYRYKINENE